MVRHSTPLSFKLGLAMSGVLLIVVLFGNFLTRFPYYKHHLESRLQRPSAQYWFGTDEFGRDVYTRVILGSRYSLTLGVGATLISLIFGVPAGLISGFSRGRRLDESIMRIMDIIMSFPPIILGMVILAVTSPSLWKTTLAVGIVYVPRITRLTRSVTLSIAEEEFVAAARARGEKIGYILFREILPNNWPPIIVEASLRVNFAILLGAALSFLGLGAQPPTPDWGLMISEGRSYVSLAPWVVLAPGFAMCFMVIGINLFGDGLREVLDPLMRHRYSEA
jgi:peptide/nickel transport system permease protein